MMVNPEQRESWPELVRHLEVLPLAELARRYGGKPGQIVAALQRVGVVRGGGAEADDELPPEPGDTRAPEPREDHGSRAGSKDALIARHAAALGGVPDAELAERAGVSVRTVASYRARHGIPGFRGPGRPPASAARAVTAPSGAKAWIVSVRRGQTVTRGVVIAESLYDAIAEAERAGVGEVEGISLVGPVRGG